VAAPVTAATLCYACAHVLASTRREPGSSFVIDGRRLDSEVWSVLADEWLSRA